MAEFIQKARLSEEPGMYPDARTMVANLVTDYEAIIHFVCEEIKTLAEKSEDVGAVDLLTRLLQQHAKMVWMLWVCLEGQTVVS
jgi:DNA-binding ferritin-like protein